MLVLVMLLAILGAVQGSDDENENSEVGDLWLSGLYDSYENLGEKPLEEHILESRSPKKKLKIDQERTITFSNTADSPVTMQCGREKGDKSNPVKTAKPNDTVSFKFKPNIFSGSTLWCTGMYKSKLMSFAASGSGAPTSKSLTYILTKEGLFLNGRLKYLWI